MELLLESACSDKIVRCPHSCRTPATTRQGSSNTGEKQELTAGESWISHLTSGAFDTTAVDYVTSV